MTKEFHNIIKEICEELGIKYTLLSKDWIIMLERDGKTKFLSGYKCDLNNQGLGEVFDDKYAMYDVLISKNIPIIKYNIAYFENNKNDYAIGCNDYSYVLSLFKQYNNNIVIKTNTGSCGSGVYHISSEDDLRDIYDKLSHKNFSISICPYYDIVNEFRGCIVDKEIKLFYKKIKPIVVGDGKSTVKELLVKFNKNYFQYYENDTILREGEVFEYDWRFNLARGSISSFDYDAKDEEIIKGIMNDAINKLSVSFGSIDVIKTKDNQYFVMEINSGLMMDNFIVQHDNGREIAKGIYKEAIEKMFE